MTEYAGWQNGAHVWWIFYRDGAKERRHGRAYLRRRPTLYGGGPWIEIEWDDGGVIGAVPEMMSGMAVRCGWNILQPSPKEVH